MADNDAPDPARLLKLARQAMTSGEYRKKFHFADFWGPSSSMSRSFASLLPAPSIISGLSAAATRSANPSRAPSKRRCT